MVLFVASIGYQEVFLASRSRTGRTKNFNPKIIKSKKKKNKYTFVFRVYVFFPFWGTLIRKKEEKRFVGY